MKTRNLLLVCLVGSLSMVASSANALSTQDFVTQASIANEFEIESSNIALQKSHNNDVKALAQQMIDDHTKTGEKLKEVLLSSNSQAQPADGLDNKHQKLIDKLQNTSDSKFDDKYLSMQKDAHKDAIKLFTSYSKHGKDDALKNFASETLPTLQDHLTHIKALKKSQ